MTDSSLSGWSGVLLPDSISGAGSKKQCRLSILARAKKQSNYYNTNGHHKAVSCISRQGTLWSVPLRLLPIKDPGVLFRTQDHPSAQHS